eukprot:PhM_4_TR9543/c0_g2_i3/m.34222
MPLTVLFFPKFETQGFSISSHCDMPIRDRVSCSDTLFIIAVTRALECIHSLGVWADGHRLRTAARRHEQQQRVDAETSNAARRRTLKEHGGANTHGHSLPKFMMMKHGGEYHLKKIEINLHRKNDVSFVFVSLRNIQCRASADT